MTTHLDILRQGADVWNTWRKQQKATLIRFSSVDLSGADLSRVDLSKVIFMEANFSGTDLNGANLSSAILSDANFSGANLNGADLSDVNTTLSLEKFIYMYNILSCNFRNATLKETNLSRANLSKANLRGANLNDAILNSANFSGAEFREAHLIKADLSHVNLRNADLSRTEITSANLSGGHLNNTNFYRAVLSHADLSDADLEGANLSEADLMNAYLKRANLSRANLRNANLNFATLSLTTLQETNLINANLSEASLSEADLREADLREADLTKAKIGWTNLGNLDLRLVKGLETVVHARPSYISTSTLERSSGEIPDTFLKGAGVSDTLVKYAHSLFGKPIEYYTCFISYSNKDELFARRLHNDLQQEGVRCWFAPADMDIGDKIKHRIDESIRLYDKLLLILSEHSIASSWVAYEVERALNKEPQGVPNVLYPVRVDQAVLACTTAWARDIKETRHIGDFEHWTDPEKYQINFHRILRSLRGKQE